MKSKLFLNNNYFFEYDYIISENSQFLIDLINEFNIINIDFLACNTLQYDNWNKYYEILQTNTNVIVGASNDETGNIKYGGDWLMENTNEDIKNIYFNESIDNYTSKLLTYININGSATTNNNIYIKQLTNNEIYYSTTDNSDNDTNTGSWTRIDTVVDWAVKVANTNSVHSEMNRLTIKFLSNISLNNVSNQFIVAPNTKFVTLDGNNKSFTLSNITDWKGLIDGGSNSDNIIIRNFILNSTGNTTLFGRAGYLLIKSSHFNNTGTNIVEYCINNCDLKLNIDGSGISGEGSFSNGDDTSNIFIIRNCTNNGNNIGQNGSGICGSKNFKNKYGINTIENCINNGNLDGLFSSGIVGYQSFSGNNNIINCVNTGNQNFRTGGITINVASLTNILNCYSTGNVSYNNNGGILLRIINNIEICNITNCYTIYGNIAYSTATDSSLITITNCYEALGNWVTTNAKTNLITNTNVWAYDKSNGSTNTTIPFVLLSLNPTNDPVYINVPCFNKDTQILTNKGYVLIQDLRKGDLIKTLLHDYIPIDMIGYREMYNSSNNDDKDKLYICSNSEYSDVTEDLIITGSHSILVDEFKQGYKEKTRELLGDIFITDNKYRLPACIDDRSNPYNKEGTFTIYHIALEHNDIFCNYGIYANGLLVESCSKRYLKELSKMTLIE